MFDATLWATNSRRDRHAIVLQEIRELNAHSCRESARNGACKMQHSVVVAKRKNQAAYFAAKGEIGNITDDYEQSPQRCYGTRILAFTDWHAQIETTLAGLVRMVVARCAFKVCRTSRDRSLLPAISRSRV